MRKPKPRAEALRAGSNKICTVLPYRCHAGSGNEKGSKRYRLSPCSDWLPGPNETANFELPISLERTPQPRIRKRKRDRDRVERIQQEGGPKSTLRERAVAFVQQKGEVRTKDLTDIGIPRCYLTRMCEEGLLIKVAYGRYRAVAGIAV